MYITNLLSRREESLQGAKCRAEHNCLVGLSTGLLAATAITCAPSLSTLISIAADIVRVAFRLGLYISDMAAQLDVVGDSSKSWTYTIPDITQESVVSILGTFHQSRVRYHRESFYNLLI